MGICYSSSKGKKSEKIDLKLRKNSCSNGDLSTFISKLSGGGGGGEERRVQQIRGRLTGNGANNVGCLYTQQGKKGINQDAMIIWEVCYFTLWIIKWCMFVIFPNFFG